MQEFFFDFDPFSDIIERLSDRGIFSAFFALLFLLLLLLLFLISLPFCLFNEWSKTWFSDN